MAPSPEPLPSPEPTPAVTPSPTAGPDASAQPVTFATVQSILRQRCSACHTFTGSYTTIADLGAKIRQRIFVERSMPRVGSEQAAAITDAERASVAAWVDAGMPKD